MLVLKVLLISCILESLFLWNVAGSGTLNVTEIEFYNWIIYQ